MIAAGYTEDEDGFEYSAEAVKKGVQMARQIVGLPATFS
jgi:hypothetical protein